MKTKIPQEPLKIGLLSENVLVKHAADGASSIISSLVTDDVKKAVVSLNEQNKRCEELRRQSEAATELRNLEVQKVEQFLRSVRDVVNANFPNQPKKLTEYGFEVDETTTKAAVKK